MYDCCGEERQLEISKEIGKKNRFYMIKEDWYFTKMKNFFQKISCFIVKSVKMDSKDSNLSSFPIANGSVSIHKNVTPPPSDKSPKHRKYIIDHEEILNDFIENTPVGIGVLDDNFNIVFVNRAVEKIFARSVSYFKGRNIKEMRLGSFFEADLIFPDQKDEEFIFVVPLFQEEEVGTMYAEFSFGGSAEENKHLFVIKNVTEFYEIAAQLRKSDTLTIVGQLAAGIAHEIRNPMTALKGFIQLLESSVEEKHTLYFSVIQSELERIETIITDFLVLAKPQSVIYQLVDLREVIDHTIELLSAQALMYNIQFEKDFGDSIKKIKGDPNQLKQVIINLIKNAIEVMPKGGKVKLRLTNRMEGLEFSVRDHGCGIPADKLLNLGKPFYTTKEKGTGLGLMVSYKIIKEHKGKITVESELNKGTTFTVYLPY